MSIIDGPLVAQSWRRNESLLLSRRARRLRRIGSLVGRGFLLAITSSSALAVLFIFYYILQDALPFFQLRGIREFFASIEWYPTRAQPSFGGLAIIVGSGIVTVGAVVVAVPLGVAAAVCLSDVLPFGVRQVVKPVVEILAAIPSVAFGFFALVVFAPALQDHGGRILSVGTWLAGGPAAVILVVAMSDIIGGRVPVRFRRFARPAIALALSVCAGLLLYRLAGRLGGIRIDSGTNALNVSVILGIMAIPTVVSVSEDALQAVGRELREGCYALGATRAETLLRVVLPAASSGICAAVILGVMRAFGETMVVLMAAGNNLKIPEPVYNLLEPVPTLTATIAREMGEADQTVGSAHYHALFAMALCLVVVSFACNMASEWAVRRSRRKAR